MPPEFRPKDIRTGPGMKMVKELFATPGMAYGAGSEDLVTHKVLFGHIYCGGGGILAQIELFFPKAGFDPVKGLKEFDALACAAGGRGGKKTRRAY